MSGTGRLFRIRLAEGRLTKEGVRALRQGNEAHTVFSGVAQISSIGEFLARPDQNKFIGENSGRLLDSDWEELILFPYFGNNAVFEVLQPWTSG